MRVAGLILQKIVALAFPITSIAQNLNLSYISSMLWTGTNDVWISGNYASMAMSNGFMIADITDPTNPAYLCVGSINWTSAGFLHNIKMLFPQGRVITGLQQTQLD